MTWGELEEGDVLMMSDSSAVILYVVRLDHVEDRTSFLLLTLENGRQSRHTLISSRPMGQDIKVLRGAEEVP